MIILDEAGTGLFALEWWSKEQINLYKEFQVIGKRQAIVELNLPHKDDLNNRMRDRRVKHWSHIVTVTDNTAHKIDRGFMEIRQANPNSWKLEVFWEPWIVCRFPAIEDEQWELYEKKKDKYIDTMTAIQQDNGNIKENGQRGHKYFVESNLLIHEMINPSIGKHKGKDGYTQTEIATLLGKKQNALSQTIKRFNELEEQKIEYYRNKAIREIGSDEKC